MISYFVIGDRTFYGIRMQILETQRIFFTKEILEYYTIVNQMLSLLIFSFIRFIYVYILHASIVTTEKDIRIDDVVSFIHSISKRSKKNEKE